MNIITPHTVFSEAAGSLAADVPESIRWLSEDVEDANEPVVASLVSFPARLAAADVFKFVAGEDGLPLLLLPDLKVAPTKMMIFFTDTTLMTHPKHVPTHIAVHEVILLTQPAPRVFCEGQTNSIYTRATREQNQPYLGCWNDAGF